MQTQRLHFAVFPKGIKRALLGQVPLCHTVPKTIEFNKPFEVAVSIAIPSDGIPQLASHTAC
jgi:hypothetical protein